MFSTENLPCNRTKPDDSRIISKALFDQRKSARQFKSHNAAPTEHRDNSNPWGPLAFDEIDNDEGLDAFFKDVSLFDLATLFKNAMDDKPILSPFELNKDPIKLEKQKEVILNYFDGEGKLSFNNLLSILKTRLEVIVTFLAILDLVKEGSCAVYQANVFSDIQLINLMLQS